MASNNPWKKFEAMLPSTVRVRGKVLLVDTLRGTSLIEQVGGATLRVFGTGAAVGRWVLVESGAIVTQLPDLPFARVEV
ncbi:hypothetical protein SJT38_13980 [Aeromonas caviae]|uniref:hypothetical protein n=1 Tax=Aeromonas caviae TaxID=648 RepID=UPI0029D72C48|nr:hypothetical protein [Aeromonas caviae]MDX7824209.1 hypothetical protein [Aeromonas caviae]